MSYKNIKQAYEFVKTSANIQPEIGVILGSGLGDFAELIEDAKIIKYKDVPHMSASTVTGHAGQFVFGKLNGKPIVVMQGRVHFYEGNTMEDVALPVQIMKLLGVEKLIVTNAAGGVNTSFNPGDLMLIEDHVNFAFNNPLIGKNNDELGTRFPDMSESYARDLIHLAEDVGRKSNIVLKKGTYFMMTGPCYETPAEIRMIRVLGGDAVGMSTVPEVIAAKHSGMKVLGISCITNMAAGILEQPLNHKEVIETSNKVKEDFITLLKSIVGRL